MVGARKTKKLNFGGLQVRRGRADDARQHMYYGCVSMLDHHIGRLMNKLDALGLRENTIVVFTSDNGPEHRTTTPFGSVGPLRGAKGHMHDGGIRVPGIVRWPGRVKPGSTSAVPVNGTDYLPTFCALAGAKVPGDRPIDGANVLPAWTGEGAVTRTTPMMWWLWHARGGKEVAMRIGNYKLLAHMTPQRVPGAIRDAQQPQGWSVMKFIKEAELAGFEMYDVANDPAETDELSKTDPERFAKLKARMIALHREIRDEGPVLQLQRKQQRRRK